MSGGRDSSLRTDAMTTAPTRDIPRAKLSGVDQDGLIIVDKPGGMTSHDVVARVRRLARTRRVGHGGTLDPMATGVLVVGVNKATRLLTYVVGARKGYAATIRLGQATVTDDAEGDVTATADAGDLGEDAIRTALAAQTGEIDQVPSAVSAIKVNGVRAYKRVREGERPDLPPRRVTVYDLTVVGVERPTPGGERPTPGVVDVAVELTCSSGTYVRAIARDVGEALGVGGHLTALRRTAVGEFTLVEAATLVDLERRAPDVLSLDLAAAARRCLPHREASADEARALSHGAPLPAMGRTEPYAVFGPDGALVAVVAERDGRARPEAVFAS
jgi:tRNA pseudouridine55 synthase